MNLGPIRTEKLRALVASAPADVLVAALVPLFQEQAREARGDSRPADAYMAALAARALTDLARELNPNYERRQS